MATIRFLGAAQEVTGSCHLLQSASFGRILLDCGLQQGGDALERMSGGWTGFTPADIDAVILSHAHMDHSGLLPKLVHDGFRGPIYCTPATAELLVIMLHDAAGLYERDLERENRQRLRRGLPPLVPEYSSADVEKALRACRSHSYGQPFDMGGAQVTFYDAGHILGSAISEIVFTEQGQQKTLVFSGDLGKRGAMLMNDPTHLTHADVVLMEGTYGNRDHRSLDDTVVQFEEILRDAWRRGGNVIIPAFAVGRTQELLFYIGLLAHQGKLDGWQIIVDSPMAIIVTHIYDRWLDELDSTDIKPLREAEKNSLREFIPRLHLSATVEQSMAINKIQRGAIIIAGSGMCNGGRIRHHIKQRIWDNHNTLVFAGFQARGTLGRVLVDGAKKIKLFGDEYVVNARIETLGGFSAHAGQTELVDWISSFTSQPRVALVHGEPEALDALSQRLWREKKIKAEAPVQGQSWVI
jgi:Predicted exonuclease of the beta-lactamase fold involved in RNA processing